MEPSSSQPRFWPSFGTLLALQFGLTAASLIVCGILGIPPKEMAAFGELLGALLFGALLERRSQGSVRRWRHQFSLMVMTLQVALVALFALQSPLVLPDQIDSTKMGTFGLLAVLEASATAYIGTWLGLFVGTWIIERQKKR